MVPRGDVRGEHSAVGRGINGGFRVRGIRGRQLVLRRTGGPHPRPLGSHLHRPRRMAMHHAVRQPRLVHACARPRGRQHPVRLLLPGRLHHLPRHRLLRHVCPAAHLERQRAGLRRVPRPGVVPRCVAAGHRQDRAGGVRAGGDAGAGTSEAGGEAVEELELCPGAVRAGAKQRRQEVQQLLPRHAGQRAAEHQEQGRVTLDLLLDRVREPPIHRHGPVCREPVDAQPAASQLWRSVRRMAVRQRREMAHARAARPHQPHHIGRLLPRPGQLLAPHVPRLRVLEVHRRGLLVRRGHHLDRRRADHHRRRSPPAGLGAALGRQRRFRCGVGLVGTPVEALVRRGVLALDGRELGPGGEARHLEEVGRAQRRLQRAWAGRQGVPGRGYGERGRELQLGPDHRPRPRTRCQPARALQHLPEQMGHGLARLELPPLHLGFGRRAQLGIAQAAGHQHQQQPRVVPDSCLRDRREPLGRAVVPPLLRRQLGAQHGPPRLCLAHPAVRQVRLKGRRAAGSIILVGINGGVSNMGESAT